MYLILDWGTRRRSIKLEYEGDKSEVKGFRTSSAGIYLLYGSTFLIHQPDQSRLCSSIPLVRKLKRKEGEGFKTNANFMFEKITVSRFQNKEKFHV